MDPYYADDFVSLYLGDMRDILPGLGEFDACVTDPPYGETSLTWDRWPEGWPALVAAHTRSMWCFGSMRMFLDRRDEFAGWKLSHDTVGEYEIDTMVWEKQNGTSFAKDRFRKVHEIAAHWYQGMWRDIYHEAPREDYHGPDKSNARGAARGEHLGSIGTLRYDDDGSRLVRSVVKVQNLHQRGAIHATQKPLAILAPLIEYAVPIGGLVLDPFAGSCSTLLTARQLDRRAVGIEANEEYAERAAERLSTPDLFAGAS